jgi:hypothetical protein
MNQFTNIHLSQGTGFVKNWGQLVGLRVLLGVLEAGYFPGCVYLLSCWYTRCKVSCPTLERVNYHWKVHVLTIRSR